MIDVAAAAEVSAAQRSCSSVGNSKKDSRAVANSLAFESRQLHTETCTA